MSRMAAIDAAVRLQLAEDGRRIDYHLTMAHLVAAGTVDTAKGYDTTTIRQFLRRVAERLRLDDPALPLNWVSLDPAQCLDAKIDMLVATISTAVPWAKPEPAAS